MPIVSNPQQQRFAIPVGNAKVILILRAYTTDEYARFIGNQFAFAKARIQDNRSIQERIDFVDSLLVGIEALDKEGQPEEIVYSYGGREDKLTPQVDNWKGHINPSWKIAVAIELEGKAAETEGIVIKN